MKQKRLFPADTFFDDMPTTMEELIDEAMDRHMALRVDPDDPNDSASWADILRELDAQRDQIGRLFKIQAKLEEVLLAILEYEDAEDDDDDDGRDVAAGVVV